MSEAGSPYGNLVAAAHIEAGAVVSGDLFGIVAAVATATGVVTLELGTDNHIAVQDRVICLTPIATSNVTTYAIVDETAGDENHIVIRTFSAAGAAANRAFHVGCFRKGINN